VKDVAPGYASGHESPPSAQAFAELVTALHSQARAIDRLASSVAALASVVADTIADDDDDNDQMTYLDGSRR
jgi:hypothetical protein